MNQAESRQRTLGATPPAGGVEAAGGMVIRHRPTGLRILLTTLSAIAPCLPLLPLGPPPDLAIAYGSCFLAGALWVESLEVFLDPGRREVRWRRWRMASVEAGSLPFAQVDRAYVEVRDPVPVFGPRSTRFLPVLVAGARVIPLSVRGFDAREEALRVAAQAETVLARRVRSPGEA